MFSEKDSVICAVCECPMDEFADGYTWFKGTLMCIYCLNDWFKFIETGLIYSFDGWIVEQRKKLKKDRGENEG